MCDSYDKCSIMFTLTKMLTATMSSTIPTTVSKTIGVRGLVSAQVKAPKASHGVMMCKEAPRFIQNVFSQSNATCALEVTQLPSASLVSTHSQTTLFQRRPPLCVLLRCAPCLYL